jgi:hypothetical protein
VALRFEDHRGFEHACLAASAAGAAAAYCAAWVGPQSVVLTWSAAGALVAVAIAAGLADELPPLACIAAAIALATVAVVAAPSLNAFIDVLAPVLRPGGAAAASGAVLGLWVGSATAPLHVRVGPDRIEQRLAQLRHRLAPGLLELAQRAVAARAAMLAAAPEHLRPALRRAVDRIALDALDLAEQGSDGSRSAMVDRVVQLERARSALAPLRSAA